MTPPSSPCIVTFLMEWNKIAAPALHYNFKDAIDLYEQVRKLFGAWLYNLTLYDPDNDMFRRPAASLQLINIPEVETFRQSYDSLPDIRVGCKYNSQHKLEYVVFTGLDNEYLLGIEGNDTYMVQVIQSVPSPIQPVPLIEAPESDLLRIIEVYVFETFPKIIDDWKAGINVNIEEWISDKSWIHGTVADETFKQYLRRTYDIVNARLMKDRFITYASAFKSSLQTIVPGASPDMHEHS